jgi:hypothetical protein
MQGAHVVRALAFAALSILAGCSDSTAPYQLPPADSSLDPNALTVGQVLHRCGTWVSAAPTSDYAVVDVFFGRRDEHDPPDGPVAAHTDFIRSIGGWSLALFNFPAIRAYLPTSAIPLVNQSWPVSSIHSVADERRYDWRATVAYDRPIASSDSATVAALGGRVMRQFANLNMLDIVLPNASFPALRHSPGVKLVEATGQPC